jgi:hypothetical protein
VAGPLVASIVGALEGAAVVGGVSAIGAGLYGLGIPKDSIVKYETALKTNRYLLVVHGAATAVAQAKHLLYSTQHVGMSLHEAKQIATSVL